MYADTLSTMMSLYQSCRVGSKKTQWPATSGSRSLSSRGSEGVPITAFGKWNSAGTESSWPVFQIGSSPHCVKYDLNFSRVGVSGAVTAPGHSATPSSSPSPDEYHGRCRYTRTPLPRRTAVFTLVLSWCSAPNTGTTYNTSGAMGRAELGTFTTTWSLARVICTDS